MKHLVRALLTLPVLAAAVFAAGVADAQVLTFDELAAPDATIMASVVCGDTSGLRFTSAHLHTIGGTITTDFTSNGTTHIGYESYRGFPITMDRVNGETFSITALDATEFYSPPRLDHPDAETVVLTGHQLGGATVTATLTLDGSRQFHTFTLPNTFVNLTSVLIRGYSTGGGEGGVALDNIHYTFGSAGTIGACVSTPATPPPGPAVALTSPVPGNVTNTIQLAATASAPAGVANVQFFVDNAAVSALLTTAPYTANLDTTTLADGQHTISVESHDGNNTLVTDSLVVTVRNAIVSSPNAHYLLLDGVDDYLQVADTSALSFGNGTTDTPLSIEMWIRPTAMSVHQLLGKWGESTNQEYRFQIGAGTLRLDLHDENAGVTTSVFTQTAYPQLVGSWHHVAVTYDGRGGASAGNGVAIYLDGVAQLVYRQNDAAYIAMSDGTDPVQIGREGPSWHHFGGAMDEIRVWHVVRSVAQIQAFMTTEVSGNEAGLVGYWRLNEGAGLLAGDQTLNASTATLINGPTWQSGGVVAPDTTAPTITAVAVTSLTATGATVSFTTSETATAAVLYSATGACPCTTVNSATTGTFHFVTLSGLASLTQYTFFVRATDLTGNVVTSSGRTFTTGGSDVTPPTVTFTAPAAGAVQGTVVFSVTATDNVGVTSVVFKVDGTVVGSTLAVPPYTFNWNSASVANGSHTITAEARDAANNLGTATRIVTVQNPVPLSIAFGAGVGLWRYTNGSWQQLHLVSPTVLLEADIDGNNVVDTIAVFPGFGTWAYMNGTTWVGLHPLDATDIKSGDVDGNGIADLVLNFTGYGLWVRFDNTSWKQLHLANPARLTVANIDGGTARADVIASFTGAGVWAYMNNTSWTRLHYLDAVDLKSGDIDGNGQTDLVVQFANYGVWMYLNNATWTQLHPWQASGIVLANIDNDGGHRSDVVLSLPGAGVWVYKNNTSWTQLHPLNPTTMAAGDLDGDGRDDVAMAFAGYGIYAWQNDTSWTGIHPYVPALMAGGR